MKKLFVLVLTLVMTLSMCVPAFAIETTPSVESKPAPEIVIQTDTEGRETRAIVYNENYDDLGGVEYVEVEVLGLENDGESHYIELVITPIADEENAPHVDIKGMLNDSYVQVESAENVGELTEEVLVACDEMELDVENLWVADLFDVSLIYDGVELIELPEGVKLKIMIKTPYKPTQNVFLLHNVEDTYWEMVDFDLSESGEMSFIMDSLSVLAIVLDKDSIDDGGEGHGESPKTGEGYGVFDYAVMGVALCLASVTVYTVYADKRKKKVN